MFGVAKDNYTAWGGRENGGNYLLRPVIGAVEMPKTERHPATPGSCRLDVFMNRDPRFALSQEVEAKQTLLDQLRALAADDPDFFTDLTEQKPAA